MRGKHRQSGLGGRAVHTVDRCGPYIFGTWHYVVFDDGFECWVPDSEFIKEVDNAC